jgi:hypothetical protein
MLPETYFDRLTHAMGARTYRRGGERRRAIRIPSSFRPTLFPVVSGCVLRPHRVRARDISMGGIGLLLPRALASTKLAVLHIKPEAADDAFVILCALQRSLKLDSSWMVGGFTFERLLHLGPSIEPDQRVSDMPWIDVSGDKQPEDPGLVFPGAAARPAWTDRAILGN